MERKAFAISLRELFVNFGCMYEEFKYDYEKIESPFRDYYTFYRDVKVENGLITLTLLLSSKYYKSKYTYNCLNINLCYDESKNVAYSFFDNEKVNTKLIFGDLKDEVVKKYCDLAKKHYKFLKLFERIEDAKLTNPDAPNIHIDFATDPFSGIHYVFFALDYANTTDAKITYDRVYFIEKEPRFQAAASNIIALTKEVTGEEFTKPMYDDILGRIYVPDVLKELGIETIL